MSQVLAGKYRLQRLLGKGGMGEVYEAFELSSGRRVAVKRLHGDPSKGGRLLREARAVAAVRSPHIVDVVDAGVDETTGDPYLAMEFLDGTDLSKVLPKGSSLPVELAVRIALHVCRGLEKAHALGIVHRDIKPANLFLVPHDDSSYRVKIVDFGLARTIVHDSGEVGDEALTQLTRTDTIVGSPAYMAPEQIRGLKSLDQRCDIWSLGVLMYRMLSGRLPHPRTDAGIGDMLVAICSDPAPPLQNQAPHVPAAVCAVVHTALAIDPAQRFQSAREMAVALEQLVPDARIALSAVADLPLAKPEAPDRTGEESGERSTVSLAHTGNTTDPMGKNPVYELPADHPVWPTTHSVVTQAVQPSMGRWYGGAAAALVVSAGVAVWAALSRAPEAAASAEPPRAEPVAANAPPVAEPAINAAPLVLPPVVTSSSSAAAEPSAAPGPTQHSKPAPRREHARPSTRPSDPFARKFE